MQKDKREVERSKKSSKYPKLNKNLPVNLATPLKLMSSIITGSERPFAFTAKIINRYDVVASRLSSTKDTGGLYVCEWTREKKID